MLRDRRPVPRRQPPRLTAAAEAEILEARAYLRAVSDHGAPAAARAVDTDPRFLPADRAAARDALVSMVSSLVGRPLRSLEYIAKLGAAQRRTEP